MDWLYDSRAECWSLLTSLSVSDYLEMVRHAHAEKGNIRGQREVLRTTTAKRIRERMIGDIVGGAILPPVVIGAVVDNGSFSQYPLEDNTSSEAFLSHIKTFELSIIDGMQRTAALLEASAMESTVLDQYIRVEFWISSSVRPLIYRMLVLNTGQVPWTLSRQLSVVYESLLKEIENNVPEIRRIFTPDKRGRRVNAAEFPGESLIEVYIAFSLRKTSVDTKETLSEEFSRLDFVENLSNAEFNEQFYTTLKLLARLDTVFDKFDSGGGGRFEKGRNIFDSQPARIGFVVAVSQHALGRPGYSRTSTEIGERMADVEIKSHALIERLESMESAAVGDFLRLDVLEEILGRKVGQVGRYERSVFFEAFRVLVEDGFEVPNLEPCWRAN